MNVLWTEKSFERLADIAAYIARDSAPAAHKWVEKMIQKVIILAEFPKSGRKVPELKGKACREFIIGNYRVVYRTRGEILYVLTVRHFKQVLPLEEIK